MKHAIEHLKKESFLSHIYLSVLLLSFHYAFVVYINSSFLSSFSSEKLVGILYSVGSIINICLLLNISKILKRFGNRKMMLGFLSLEILALLLLSVSKSILVIAPVFIIHHAIVSLLLFSLDIFLETSLKSETHTGGVRGIFLTMSNLAFVFSPYLVGQILQEQSYWKIYLVSALFLLPLVSIIFYKFKHFSDARYSAVPLEKSIKTFFENRNLSNIFIVGLILQFFYAWMVIYTPLYLHNHIGFSWAQIGEMFTVMLLPFIIFQIPGGKIADEIMGEKELLILGFAIMAGSTFMIPFLNGANMIAWTVLLFFTRVGASLVEIMTETYFFKHVKGKDANIISVFRTTSPLSYIITPFIAAIAFSAVPFRFAYIALSLIILIGIRYALRIEDTVPAREKAEVLS